MLDLLEFFNVFVDELNFGRDVDSIDTVVENDFYILVSFSLFGFKHIFSLYHGLSVIGQPVENGVVCAYGFFGAFHEDAHAVDVLEPCAAVPPVVFFVSELLHASFHALHWRHCDEAVQLSNVELLRILAHQSHEHLVCELLEVFMLPVRNRDEVLELDGVELFAQRRVLPALQLFRKASVHLVPVLCDLYQFQVQQVLLAGVLIDLLFEYPLLSLREFLRLHLHGADDVFVSASYLRRHICQVL